MYGFIKINEYKNKTCLLLVQLLRLIKLLRLKNSQFSARHQKESFFSSFFMLSTQPIIYFPLKIIVFTQFREYSPKKINIPNFWVKNDFQKRERMGDDFLRK